MPSHPSCPRKFDPYKLLDPQNRRNSEWLATLGIVLEPDAREKLSTFGSFRSVQAICNVLANAPRVRLEDFAVKPAAVYDQAMHQGLCHHYFGQWTRELDILEQHFASLRSLTLSISRDGYDTLADKDEAPAFQNLTRLIKAARNVETVYLDIDDADPAATMLGMSDYPNSSLEAVSLSSHSERHFRNLGAITFTYSTLRYGSLLQLLREYTSTLRYLRVDECNLEGGYWGDILDTLRYHFDFALLRSIDRFKMVIDYVSDGGGGVYFEDKRPCSALKLSRMTWVLARCIFVESKTSSRLQETS